MQEFLYWSLKNVEGSKKKKVYIDMYIWKVDILLPNFWTEVGISVLKLYE